jgi:hypothetical protein
LKKVRGTLKLLLHSMTRVYFSRPDGMPGLQPAVRAAVPGSALVALELVQERVLRRKMRTLQLGLHDPRVVLIAGRSEKQ